MRYKAKYDDNGVLTVQPIIKRVKNKNGGYDVIVHAPSLKLINKFQEEQERKQNGQWLLYKIQVRVNDQKV